MRLYFVNAVSLVFRSLVILSGSNITHLIWMLREQLLAFSLRKLGVRFPPGLDEVGLRLRLSKLAQALLRLWRAQHVGFRSNSVILTADL